MRTMRKTMIWLAMTVVAGMTESPAAQTPDDAPLAVPPTPRTEARQAGTTNPRQNDHALSRVDLETWLDGYMAHGLKATDTAGAIVAVVKDGDVLLEKGYGYADVDALIPVVADRTLFRMGSVSKLFTWTAVMQLVEEGKIDLDRDINAYLDFRIPPRDGQPVTTRDLLTHTPGFEEWVRYLWLPDASYLKPLGDYLKMWVPERVYAAGTTPAYSNYGSALAGYIVERLSGRSFDDYVEQHIFTPLGMSRSTFRQPLPERFEADMSKGYASSPGAEVPYEILSLAPAGSMTSTASDMARFMLAHLQHGELGGARILAPDIARQMYTTPRELLPPLNHMMLGFYEDNMNGRAIIGHDGDTHYFHSALRLFVADNIGLLVSVNTGSGYKLRSSLVEDFADRYLPAGTKRQPTAGVDAETARSHARQIAGHYDNSRGFRSSPLHLLSLFRQTVITANNDGSIALAGQAGTWREVEPYVWHIARGRGRLAAKVVNGQVVRFAMDDTSPYMAFDRTPWWQVSAWLLPALKLAVGVLVLTSIFWPAAALVRRRYSTPFRLAGREALSYRLVNGVALTVLAVLAALIVTGETTLADDTRLTLINDAWLWLLQFLILTVGLAAAGIALWNVWVVWSGNRGWPARLWSMMLISAIAVFLWAAVAFNVVAFSVDF